MITVRARWLAAAGAGGAALGHLLDELGALPGIHESRAVRLAALDPARAPGIVLLLIGCVLSAVLADRVLRRSAVVAALVLLVGQLTAATGLESIARGRLDAGFLEHGGLLAVSIQLAVALLVVVAASLTALALSRLPRSTRLLIGSGTPARSPRRRRLPRRRQVSYRGRAPPLVRSVPSPDL